MGAIIPFASTAVVAIVATAICANSYRVGTQLGVIDLPDNTRKLHHAAVPLVGGIAILFAASLWFVFMLFLDGVATHTLRVAMIICGVGAGLIGYVDDRGGIAPSKRMALLFLLAFAALAIHPGLIAATAHWTPSVTLPISPVIFCILFAVSAVGVVNAVNMADGQNGIVGAMYVSWIVCLLISGDRNRFATTLMLLPLTVVFLIYNLREKLFLGDCGSYGVTFVLGILVGAEYSSGELTLTTIIAWFFVPVVDCLRLMVVRVLRGRSPFLADRNHMHHRLMETFGQRYTLLVYGAVVASASIITTVKPGLAVLSLSVLAALYLVALFATRSQKIHREGEQQSIA